MYVVWFAMCFNIVSSITSAYGSIMESRFALGSTIVLRVITMLLEFIGAIVICIYGVEESDILTEDLREVFYKLIYRMDYDNRANRILKIVQEYVSKADYQQHNTPTSVL